MCLRDHRAMILLISLVFLVESFFTALLCVGPDATYDLERSLSIRSPGAEE